MRGDEVADLLTSLAATGIVVWVDGGWGVDALVGRETRQHHDLDVVISTADVDRFSAWITSRGYRLVAGEPGSGLYRDDEGRAVDVGAIDFAPDGSGTYHSGKGTAVHHPAEAFQGRGTIGGVDVRCLSADAQLAAHTGYEHAPKDAHDMRLLRDAVGRRSANPPNARLDGPPTGQGSSR